MFKDKVHQYVQPVSDTYPNVLVLKSPAPYWMNTGLNVVVQDGREKGPGVTFT